MKINRALNSTLSVRLQDLYLREDGVCSVRAISFQSMDLTLPHVGKQTVNAEARSQTFHCVMRVR